MTYFKLKYIEKNDRLNPFYQDDPDWKNKIKAIQNRFSEIIDTIRRELPEYTCYTENHGDHEWSPFWIAVLETQAEFNLPGEHYVTEYQIDPNTNEITMDEIN